MTPKRMLAGALLLLSIVTQPSLSSPYVLMRQASPFLYPASYPSTSSSQVTLNNGLYSPWSSFYYPSVINQRNTALAALKDPAALQAPAAGATNPAGCGTWTSSDAGCYKHFGEEPKSWQEAREQCREEGRREGVSDADLAYLKPKEAERNKVITDLGLDNSDKSWWLNGKYTTGGTVALKDSNWESIPITDAEWIGGSAPTFDINAKNIFIRPNEKKLGADPGVFKHGFICEFKKRVCKDSTWEFDSSNQRCLKVFSEEKTYQNAKVVCETESLDSTLASLVPSEGTKLKDLIIESKNFGTWVLESASKDATGKLQFTKPIRGSATGSAPVTEQLDHWNIDPNYKAVLNIFSRHLSLNSAGGLIPVFDSNAKAHFICQHALDFGVAFAANKPLERSLLSFNPNV